MTAILMHITQCFKQYHKLILSNETKRIESRLIKMKVYLRWFHFTCFVKIKFWHQLIQFSIEKFFLLLLRSHSWEEMRKYISLNWKMNTWHYGYYQFIFFPCFCLIPYAIRSFPYCFDCASGVVFLLVCGFASVRLTSSETKQKIYVYKKNKQSHMCYVTL